MIIHRIVNFLRLSVNFGRRLGGSSLWKQMGLTATILYAVAYWKIKGSRVFSLALSYQGIPFVFDTQERMDIAVLEEVFLNGDYDHVYCNQHPRNIVDLGANIGDTAIFYALRFPQAQVYAYEPNPEVFARLQHNTRTYPNIHPVQAAVTNHSGQIDLHIGDSHLGSSLGDRFDYTEHRVVSVPAYTLADVCTKHGIDSIDLLKFDIEGAEQDIMTSEHFSSYVREYVGELHADLVNIPLDRLINIPGFSLLSKRQLSLQRYIIHAIHE